MMLKYIYIYMCVCVYVYVYIYVCVWVCVCVCVCILRVSQEECARLQEGVPYVKVYRYNPKHIRSISKVERLRR